MPFVDKMHLSFIKKEYDSDTYFQVWNEEEWQMEKEEEDYSEFTFVIYGRKK